MVETIKATLANCLVGLGWSHEKGTAFASKTFETAVGPKQALVYLAEFGPSENLMLQGQYWSEGSNALEPHCVLVSRTASFEQLQQVATEFARKADSVVSETYAAKLLRALA